jgi:hypothetical protein
MEVPPPYIYDSHVVEYADVDDSVVFEQRRWINVNGEWLGKVPCLAICQDFKSLEYLIEFCAADWEPLARAPGYESIEKAKARLERSYHGLGAKWIRAEMTFEETLALRRLELREDSCTFCGRTPLEMNKMITTKDHFVRICDQCIDRFHESIHRGD